MAIEDKRMLPMNDHETIERAALTSLYVNCPEETRNALGLFFEDVEDARVFGARHEPSTLLNRTIGLGGREPLTSATVEAVRTVYSRNEIARYLLQIYPDRLAQGPAMLEAASLARVRGWMTFSRDNSSCAERETDLRIERVGKERAEHFGRIAAAAFGLSAGAASLPAALVHDPSWHIFVSYDGDRPAGTGALFVDGNCGWLDWAATAPEFRRRGSQGAVISRRIRQAGASGCKTLFTETGEAVASDPQHSYRNLRRFGFEEAGLRENWAPV